MSAPILPQRASARRLRGFVFFWNPVTAALLAQMFAQELTRAGIEHTHDAPIPLHIDGSADPTGRHAVISCFDFDAAIEVHAPLAELIVAERLQRQRRQGGLLFRKHRRYLPLYRTVDARVGPVCLPAVQIRLSFFETFEALALQWRILGVADASFHFALSIRITDTAR